MKKRGGRRFEVRCAIHAVDVCCLSNQIKFIKQQRAKSHLQVAKTIIKIAFTFIACAPAYTHCDYCDAINGCWEQKCETGYGINMLPSDLFCHSTSSCCHTTLSRRGPTRHACIQPVCSLHFTVVCNLHTSYAACIRPCTSCMQAACIPSGALALRLLISLFIIE